MPTDKQLAREIPTNIRGVVAAKALPGQRQSVEEQGAAIGRELLGDYFHSQDVALQPVRERILGRLWLAQDRIIPHLAPQAGITHRLLPAARVADGAFTSNNWSGCTIAGTWISALGIWTVPTVIRPSTPAGTDGGWDSSSWVGIDGTYGSNDVLQAGVQQSVGGDGSARYVAWFEWFAPQVDGSPDYIFQTNIDNIDVEPGDEIYVSVRYVNGQGVVSFGNVTRGHYFSITLDPPPGASFSGNSAEWIMEAPNTGEPGTSLPNFAAVDFTAALSTDQKGTLGDPASGDTIDIVAYGRNLTSVQLGTDSLTIDYLVGWYQVHPETVFDHAAQQVQVVSRAPGNLDLFVIGFDNAVWSTFWNDQVGWNPGGWFQLHPETVFDHAAQQVQVVSRAPGNLDLFVIGFDNAVWSTFWNDQVGWNPGGWFQLHPETVFDHAAQQVQVVSRAPGNLDLFVIGFDNAVWSTFWNDQVGWNPGGWFQLHPETVFDHAAQQVQVVSRAPGNLDLFVIGFDNAVWSTFWNDQVGWNPGGWFQLHPETVFDHAAQQVQVVSRAPGNLDLFVIGFDNAVWSTFWNDQVGWNPGGWFQLHPETVFDHAAQQVQVVSRAPGNLDLFVIGFDNAVWSEFWNDQTGWN